MMRSTIAAFALAVLALTGASATEQWPQFRGPQAGLAADDAALPDTWSEHENIVWRVDIPGLGWSSPVVWDDHVLVTSSISSGQERAPIPGLYDPGDENGSLKSASEHRWMVYDVDFNTGKIRWARELLRTPPPLGKNSLNEMSMATPAIVRGSLIMRTHSKLYRIARKVSR